MTEEHFNALPTGYKLYEYTIKSVLGHGGFGITYLAYDENLNKDVAIKEYLPAEFAVRQGTETVRPRSSADGDDYEWGLERFMKEAQTLALFRHPSIVPVFRFFRANGTAYMVMEYQEGESLAALMRQHRGEFTEEDLLQLVEPILDGLAEVHKAGYLHRDVKPGNIYIRQDGTPVLLDFGAARAAVGRKSHSLTSIVTPGYAPLEQYFADGNQGPWTDIYALAAILYQAVAGRIPPEAPARVKNDPIASAREAGKGRFSPLFLAAIDRALMVEEEDRPQTTTEWRDMLIGRIPAFSDGAAAADEVDAGATMIAGAAPVAEPGARTAAATGRETRLFEDRRPVTGPPPAGRSGSAARVAVIAGAILVLMTVGAGAGYFVLKESGGLGDFLSTIDGSKTGNTSTVTKDSDAARRKAEAEAKRKAAAEEAKKKAAAAEAQRKAAEAAKRKAAEEAKRKAAASAKRKAAEEARRKAAAEKAKQEAEAKRRAAREAEAKRQAEAKRKAEQERLKREAQQREEAARQRAEAERKRREQDERRRAQRANLNGGVSCPSSLAALNGAYSDATDCFFVRRVFISALSTGIKGSTSRWSNSRSGNSGTLTVLKAVQRADGTFCRRFQQTVTAHGVTRRGVGLACFIGNQWKITS
jgi:surface antigen